MEGFGVQTVYSHERYGDWCWLSNEVPAQVCRRLDARERRLNSELLRAIDEGATQRVARYTILSFSIVSDDRSKASSKTIPPHSAI